MVSWLTETSLPRTAAGANSAIYIGERFEANPMATPPAIRHRLNANKVAAMPVPTDDTANTTAARIKRRLRPNLSLEPPATTAPRRQPTTALPIAQPCCEGVAKWKDRS